MGQSGKLRADGVRAGDLGGEPAEDEHGERESRRGGRAAEELRGAARRRRSRRSRRRARAPATSVREQRRGERSSGRPSPTGTFSIQTVTAPKSAVVTTSPSATQTGRSTPARATDAASALRAASRRPRSQRRSSPRSTRASSRCVHSMTSVGWSIGGNQAPSQRGQCVAAAHPRTGDADEGAEHDVEHGDGEREPQQRAKGARDGHGVRLRAKTWHVVHRHRHRHRGRVHRAPREAEDEQRASPPAG